MIHCHRGAGAFSRSDQLIQPLIQQISFRDLERPGGEYFQTILPLTGQGRGRTLTYELLSGEDTMSNSFSSPQITKANYLVTYLINWFGVCDISIPVHAHMCASTPTCVQTHPLFIGCFPQSLLHSVCLLRPGLNKKLRAHSFG